ncbi:unnamed protein product [Urochloa decumbens]|uniref:DUF1618 domain-containing protein n=1 Tax=Urochloa decumbens TaxID=240449 RepID=A0ABC9H4K3_9POAL
MSAAAGGSFPKWVLLEPFVFRRDDDESFPDDTKAPIMASGTTSLEAPFNVAFSLAEPPLISRLYAQLPGFPGPRKQVPLAILATHRNLALFRVATSVPGGFMWQDFFIYDSSCGDNPCSLKALPPCTEPDIDYFGLGPPPCTHGGEAEGAPANKRRLLAVKSMGILCRGEQDQFAVAELNLFKSRRTEVYADICLFKSSSAQSSSFGWQDFFISLFKSSSAGHGDQIGGEWDSMRVPILHSGNPDDVCQLCLWQTDAVVPVGDRWLCWVDYYRGILFCDVFGEPDPTVSFLRFPLDKFPDTHSRSRASSWLYRGVSAIDAGRKLKFVDVARDDGIGYGALKPNASFTITCHTLTLPVLGSSMVLNKDTLSSMVWNKDAPGITSGELWRTDNGRLPREVLMFPQVNIDRPNVVHFLVISSYGYVMLKMWLVAVDMNTRTVESVTQYINGEEDIGTEDADLTHGRSRCPMPFLPCEFSKYLRRSFLKVIYFAS